MTRLSPSMTGHARDPKAAVTSSPPVPGRPNPEPDLPGLTPDDEGEQPDEDGDGPVSRG